VDFGLGNVMVIVQHQDKVGFQSRKFLDQWDQQMSVILQYRQFIYPNVIINFLQGRDKITKEKEKAVI
jgi:hypothetical protein